MRFSMRRRSSKSVKSAARASASPSSRASSCKRSSRRATRMRRYPSRASRRAKQAPMPAEAPVINASGFAMRLFPFGLEQKAAAGESRFGFLQLRDIERPHLETEPRDEFGSAGKGRRNQSGIANGQDVGGTGLLGRHIDNFEAVEMSRIDPRTIGKKDTVTESAASRFQMQ